MFKMLTYSEFQLVFTFETSKPREKSILSDVERLLDDIIMKSRHFSNVDKTSHLIRPSVLYLLNQFADFDSLSPERASDWSKRITESVLQLGAISPNSNCSMLNELCVRGRYLLFWFIPIFPIKTVLNRILI